MFTSFPIVSAKDNLSTFDHLPIIKANATKLRDLFNDLLPQVVVGAIPSKLKNRAFTWAKQAGFRLPQAQISFCRFGYLHPPLDDQFNQIPLRPSEIFTIDIWFKHQNYWVDMAMPVCLPPHTSAGKKLYDAALACHDHAIEAITIDHTLFTIAHAVEETAKAHNCFIIEQAQGHGIGKNLHEDPAIAFTYHAHHLFDKLRPSIFTIEPVISLTKQQLVIDNKKKVAYANHKQPILFKESLIILQKDQKLVL